MELQRGLGMALAHQYHEKNRRAEFAFSYPTPLHYRISYLQLVCFYFLRNSYKLGLAIGCKTLV
jgi:hypothetical protein